MKVLCVLAVLSLTACASNPPQEAKSPPKCHGPYTPINTPDHYAPVTAAKAKDSR
jgi:hypothetical protein